MNYTKLKLTLVILSFLSPTMPLKINSEILNNRSEFFNFGEQKHVKLGKIDLENSILKSKVDVLGEIFKQNIEILKIQKELDLVFLIDASSSVGEKNFKSELRFVKKLLSDIPIDFNHTRVAIITFSSAENVVANVDEISFPNPDNNKCLLLNKELNNIKYSGGGTYTMGAFKLAKRIFENSRNESKKALFLVTDGFSNGGDPVPLANDLKNNQVTIFTIGIETGNYRELYQLSTAPGELYSYLLDSFQEFESLARRALHVDLKSGDYIPLGSSHHCNGLCEEGADCCDTNAVCACGTSTGHYSCLCAPGYYGSGLRNGCSSCPSGSYSDGVNLCFPCPDVHHVSKPPAIGLGSCECKPGFQATRNNRCEVLKCPKLSPPEHGYFVKRKECGNVLYSACGVRCEVGYTLSGSSIRLCQANATWSGDTASCQVKFCDKLSPPAYGSFSCKHADLDTTYDDADTQLPVDTVCSFTCSKGRSLIGSRQRTCLPLAQWDGLRTSCKQIKCNKLTYIQNGHIQPNSCSVGKQAYGRNCTLSCDEGYELEGSGVVSCTGQHGSWEPKVEDSVCTDKTPPVIKCPDDIKGAALPGKKYGTVVWQEPNATDNSLSEVFVWLKPSVRNITEFKFQIGRTNLTYFAQDASNNRAKCKFAVIIDDNEAPTIEDCENPPIFLATEKTGAYVTWDEPNISDNSQNFKVSKSHEFGFFPIGSTMVTYTATDPHNNTNSCVMNITVEDPHCEALADPIFGHSDCATNKESLHCVITCQEGYALPLDNPTQIIGSDNFTTFVCNHSDPIWYNVEGDTFPDCTVTEVPTGVEHTGTITLKPEGDVCEDSMKMREFENDIRSTLHNSLKYTCTATSCSLSTDAYCENDDDSVEEEKTNIIKRDAEKVAKKKHKKRKRLNLTFNVKTDFSRLNSSAVFNNITSNLKDVKFLGLHNESIQYSVLLDKPKIICPLGYVLKKTRCVQCPKGTFHNLTINRCQSCPIGFYSDFVGQLACKTCPLHHSTRKLNSKSANSCKEECPPGTYARKKTIKLKKQSNATVERLTLKPHCRSCPVGTYQPDYGQNRCVKCANDYFTLNVGAASYEDCVPTAQTLCTSGENVCNNGFCVPEGIFYYSCNCFPNFVGSHCENRVNKCNSNPCLNNGTCVPNFTTSNDNKEFECVCKSGYTGKYCQEVVENCHLNCLNNGRCVQTEDEQYFCICPQGYGGEFCERKLHHCTETTCENNGKCVETPDAFKCICVGGHIGTHCSIVPCDYRPCPGNAVCSNLDVANATRSSYRCDCPEGYKGRDCSEKIDFCESNPCVNGGKCVSGDAEFSCVCPKEFEGKDCGVERNSSYVLKFPRSETVSYVKLREFEVNLSEITVCLWMKTADSFNYGTLVSYANARYDNAFTLTDYTGLVFYINNKHAITDIFLNDGKWHHVCALWQSNGGSYSIYVDGILKQNGSKLSDCQIVEGSGNMVIGQEQDIQGGKFSQSESFLGEISHLNVWSRSLTEMEIFDNMESCYGDYGDLYAWPEIQDFIYGDVQIEGSNFCAVCDFPKPLFNGLIDVEGNIAYYKCNPGYVLNELTYVNGRKCLKTSEWEGTYDPFCKKVFCGNPGFIRNGYIIGRDFFYTNKITYHCYDSYKLLGAATRICREDGNWFPNKPACQGAQCTVFKKPANSDLTIIAEQSYEDSVETHTKFEVGTQIEVKCNQNSNISGENVITCLESGEWDFEPPVCVDNRPRKKQQLPCQVDQVPAAPPHGYVVLESVYAAGNGTGSVVEYRCRFGYTLRGDSSTVCILDGYWTEPNTTCEPTFCGEPPSVERMVAKHVNVTNNTYHFGNMVTYECVEGFKMFGSNILRCLADGTWTNMQGKCARKDCRKPLVSENASVEGSSYLFGDSVTVTCPNKQSYVLTCNEKGQWFGNRNHTC